jgi:glyoxylase-like metal-dependent hydrolase (beta-lactamase superfamily II)
MEVIESAARGPNRRAPQVTPGLRAARIVIATWMAIIGCAAQPADAADAALRPVAPGVFVLPDTFLPGRQPDGNSVVFVGPKGIVVVDTGRHLEHAQALLDFAAVRKLPIVTIVNSHWHLDHLGGNALLRERTAGLEVIASDAVAPALAGWLADSRRSMLELLASGQADATTTAMAKVDIGLIERGAQLLPDRTLHGPASTDASGVPLAIGLERHAVTAADLWVWDAASRVLAAGDLVTLPAPFLDTACAPGWRAALARLEQVSFELLVPGHGAPMRRADFATWRRAFDGLLDCAAGPDSDDRCADGWIGALGDLLPAAERAQGRGMAKYYLAEHLRAAPAVRDRYCPAVAGAAK